MARAITGQVRDACGDTVVVRILYLYTVYVRGPNDEDLSGVVRSVVFTLHHSFAHPVRGVGGCTRARQS